MRLYCLQMQRQDVHKRQILQVLNISNKYTTLKKNNNNHVFGFNANIQGIYSQTYK